MRISCVGVCEWLVWPFELWMPFLRVVFIQAFSQWGPIGLGQGLRLGLGLPINVVGATNLYSLQSHSSLFWSLESKLPLDWNFATWRVTMT